MWDGSIRASGRCAPIDLHVRGRIPDSVAGTLLVPCSRRHKRRDVYSRWHDSQADLIRLTLKPGVPGRVRAEIIAIDPLAKGVNGAQADWLDLCANGTDPAFGYVTQPNHGVNAANGRIWITNLIFGAPLELDADTLNPIRVLQPVQVSDDMPRVTSTAHFAFSLDSRYAYFHQSTLARERNGGPVRSGQVYLIRIDLRTGNLRTWLVKPPAGMDMSSVNFHSAFYFEEAERKYIGLLQTAALLETVGPGGQVRRTTNARMQYSEIWIIEVDEQRDELPAELISGIREIAGYALSHLCVDNKDGNGFVLFANYKNSDVGDETRGENIYGAAPDAVIEHYSGMIVEAFDCGKVIRVERRNGTYRIKVFSQDYFHAANSRGHTWLPINLDLDASRKYVFCNFNGLRPRLVGRHTYDLYEPECLKPSVARNIPEVHMRLRADDLTLDLRSNRSHVAYTLPSAMAIIGDVETGYMCTFSPEMGLFITPLNDLSKLVCHAVGHELWTYGTTHFRPEPAHAIHLPA
jgi:hypothetical protein